MRIVVVGGGYAGLASSVRLAKLGHDVTLLERSPHLGGALSRVEAGGFAWDAGPTHTLLPAVLRDLFRKSGRPLERELDLEPLRVIREHRFADGTRLALPGGSRAAQHAALEGLGSGLGDVWSSYVDGLADTWELLRRGYLERPYSAALGDRDLARLLDSRESLARRARKALRDTRLREVAAYPFVAGGHDPRDVPWWAGVAAYVERSFGAWTVPGGMASVADALTARLATRRVTALTGTDARDLVVREGRVRAVVTDAGEHEADAVVVAVDPRRLPALAPHVARTVPALPPVVCHLGLEGEVPDLPHEVVLHGDPLLTVRTGGTAPDGAHAWTLHGHRFAEDPVAALARHGIDVRRQVRARVDRTPRDLVELFGGSPLGVQWQGRGTVRRRLGPTTPVAGVYAAGAHATPGAGLPYAGLSAALVAQAIGPA